MVAAEGGRTPDMQILVNPSAKAMGNLYTTRGHCVSESTLGNCIAQNT